MIKHFDGVVQTTATTGAGTITLGAVLNSQYFSFAEAGAVDGDKVFYRIDEGGDVEIGIGTIGNSETELSRDTVLASRIGGTPGAAKMTLAGAAQIRCVATAMSLLHDLGGATTVGGTANAIEITPSDGNDLPLLYNGFVISFRAASTNTGAVTADVGNQGAEPVKKAVNGVETALAAGDIQAGTLYLLVWNAAWDSAAGAFELVKLGVPHPKTAKLATGSYTGDGSTSQAITGLGFAPKVLQIIEGSSDGTNARYFWTSSEFVVSDPQGFAMLLGGGSNAGSTLDNRVVSLDSDGFTVSDDGADEDPNQTGSTYYFTALGY